MSGKHKMVFSFLILSFLFLIGRAVAQNDDAFLTLEDCIHIALENNSDLKTTLYSDQAAKWDEVGSLKGILPSISVSAGRGEVETGASEYLSNEPVGIDPETGNVIYEQRTRTIAKSIRKSTSASVDVSQTIFDGGIWWNQIRKAQVDKKVSDYTLASQRDYTILQVQQAYFDLIKQIKILEVDSLAVDRSKAQLDRTQKMYELGATAQVDVFRAKVNLGNDRIQYLKQKNVVAQSRKNLNLVMGRDPFEPLQVEVEIPAVGTLPDVDELIETALKKQPLIYKNQEELKSRKLSVALAKGINYPRISAYINYNRFHETPIKVFSDFDQNYQTQYGVRMSFNLFNGFSDYVNIQKAEIGVRSAAEQYEAYKRNLKSTIHQYYADYLSYLDIIEINRLNLEAAREEYRLAKERYQVGAGTSLEVRESQVNLTKAEETLIVAQFNARFVLAQLDYNLGLSYAKYAGESE